MTEKPVQFAVDASVLGALGLATLASKEKFLANMPSGEEIYDDILWLDYLIRNNEVELILPYTVMKGLKARNPNANNPEHKAEKLARQEKYKRFAKMYMNGQPNIKIAYVNGGFVGDFLYFVDNLATLYTEEASDGYGLSIPYNERTKPFVPYNNNLSYPALKMAESTLLGLDFLTLNTKYFLKKPVHVQNTIQKINKQYLNSDVKPLAFDQALAIMDDLEKLESYINKTEARPKIATELLDYKNFKKHAHKVNMEKRSTRELHNTRTLFIKYLDTPLNLEDLKPAQDDDLQM
ncbi:MAG: hypothetical protein J6A98_03370 [Clostridia bacterium]|nr:hypothetical protein [Clostridia bacterium]